MNPPPVRYHLDLETYSPEDIGGVGAFKYSAHPETEILIMSIAKGDEPPLVWTVLDEDPDALMMLHEAITTRAEIWAHNAQFEFSVFRHAATRAFGKDMVPKLDQWHCTASLCRLAAIPSSLENAGEFLAIETPKDREGTRLIQKFSVPRKPTRGDARTRIHPHDDPEDFQRFADYCRRDVEAERAILHKIKLIDQACPGHRSYLADLRMNTRGIPVNRTALENANRMINEYGEMLVPKFRDQVKSPGRSLTLPVTSQRKVPKTVLLEDGFNPSQREMMMAWLKERGFTGTDLTSDTVDSWLTDPNLASQLTDQARAALQTYSLVTSAAVKKIPAMLNMVEADGYIRGALLVFGAERTHRWTGKGIQPQNFARPTIKFTELAYEAICNGWSWRDIEDNFGDLYDVLASCIRHFIQPHKGMVLQADYSAIEARVAPWLAREDDTLELFRANAPIYERMAALIFHKKVADVVSEERFIGKQTVLGCSYNMGRKKFKGTLVSYGYSPSPEMVEAYKPKHVRFVATAVEKVRNEIQRKFDRKNMEVPEKYQSMEYLVRRACVDNEWHTINPETEAEWASFTLDELADRAVSTWRKNNPKVVAMWRQLDDAAKAAIESPGTRTNAGRINFMQLKDDVLGFPALGMQLPSGHYLIYPMASVVPNESRGWGTQIRFWGVIPNTGGQWGWCYTYGGKLLENATQATAGDVMREGMMAAEADGYEPFMLVHDEMLAIQKPGQTHERLCELLCTMPAWADGLPLKAEGSTIPFYKK